MLSRVHVVACLGAHSGIIAIGLAEGGVLGTDRRRVIVLAQRCTNCARKLDRVAPARYEWC